MMEVLISDILKEIDLTEAEKDIIKSSFTIKKLRKRQYLMKTGDILRGLYFVEKGMLRAYLKGERDTEHVIHRCRSSRACPGPSSTCRRSCSTGPAPDSRPV